MILSIVIPVYNEEESVERVVSNCLEAKEPLLNLSGINDVEIIVVNDGSKDNTAKLVSKFQNVRLISQPENMGYGKALMTGF